MTPPTVQFIPAAGDGFTALVSAPCVSALDHYSTHTNIVGDAEWDGRNATQSWYFDFVSGTASNIWFYFGNDTARDLAFSSYSSWKLVGTDGADVAFYNVFKGSSSRIFFQVNYVFQVGETYTIKGQ